MISRVDLGRLSGIWWSEIWDGGLGTVRIILGEYGTEDYLPPPPPSSRGGGGGGAGIISDLNDKSADLFKLLAAVLC